jgi:hypothetical protein
MDRLWRANRPAGQAAGRASGWLDITEMARKQLVLLGKQYRTLVSYLLAVATHMILFQ